LLFVCTCNGSSRFSLPWRALCPSMCSIIMISYISQCIAINTTLRIIKCCFIPLISAVYVDMTNKAGVVITYERVLRLVLNSYYYWQSISS
jgi:hypothetical protein